MDKLKAGVIGVGYLGRFHAQKYAALPDVELTGVVDTDQDRAEEVASELGSKAFQRPEDLLPEVDLVSIAVPTQHHYEVARMCLESGVNILLEKPITQTVEEADHLIALAEEGGLVFQVGHLERFNEAVMALRGRITDPMFVESLRLASFQPRGTDVSVVLDLMIHDIDIILNIVPSTISSIDSLGVPVISPEVDMANARIKFESGCVADVTASRVSRKNLREIRIFQPDTYVSIDYMARKISIVQKGGEGFPVPGMPELTVNEMAFEQGDALLAEISSFVDAVRQGTQPVVSGHDGKRALELAITISSNFRSAGPDAG